MLFVDNASSWAAKIPLSASFFKYLFFNHSYNFLHFSMIFCFVFYFDVLLYSRTSFLPTSASMFSLDVCRYFLRHFTSICTQCSSPVNFLPPSALLKHNLSTSTFWWCARYSVNSFAVFPISNNIWLLTLPMLIVLIMFPPLSLDLNIFLLHLM